MILQRSLAALNKAGARIILGCDTGLEDHLFGYAEQEVIGQNLDDLVGNRPEIHDEAVAWSAEAW